ncbi:MAG: DUF6261 family protein [Prevotellaceae bacterium]|jgi:hypothetical protein|nr:DUF6261 family protein [Prevotellaceae bacterium]
MAKTTCLKGFIKKISLSRLPNEEHNKFMCDLLDLIANANDAVGNAITKILPEFANLVEDENTIIKITYENKLKEMLAQTDKLRDGLFRAIQAIVAAYIDSPLEEEARIAKKLKVLFDKFDNIYQLPPLDKTDAIHRLFYELEIHVDTYNQLHLADFFKDLRTATNMYEGLYKGHTSAYSDIGAIAVVKGIRLKADELYAQIIEAIESDMLIYGISRYSNFVIALNALIGELRGKANSGEKRATTNKSGNSKPIKR